MATCSVTLTSNVTAVAGRVVYQPLPNQVVDGLAIDTTPVTASVATTVYTATLTRKVKYRLVSDYFQFSDMVFEVPDAASADLTDLLEATAGD